MDKRRISDRAGTVGRRLRPARLALWQWLLVVCLAVVGLAGLAGSHQAGGTGRSTPGAPVAAQARRSAKALAVPAAAPYAADNLSATHSPSSGSSFAGASAGRPALEPVNASSTSGTSAIAAADVAQARVQKTGSMVVIMPAARLQAGLTDLMSLATADGGFVLSSGTQSAGNGSPAQATATLDVPVAAFETAIGQVSRLGKVSSLSTQAQDLTGQYADLQAQIASLQSSRQQYLTIMAKATTVGQVLAVQAQLSSVDSQLQQLQSQQQVMDNETTYSTLSVTLTQKVVTPPPPHPESGIDKAWHSAVSGFVTGVEGVISVAGPLLFALLLLSALYLAGRWAFHLHLRRRPRHPAYAEPGTGA